MDIRTFDTLLSGRAASDLQELTTEWTDRSDTLRELTRLRRYHPPALAAAIVEQARLRARARAKFDRSEGMYFAAEALEQASAEVVAVHRARRYAGCTAVVDLGCGIGGDAIGLTGVTTVLGLDHDPLRLRLAYENLRVYGRATRFHPLRADMVAPPLIRAQPFWADPARRTEGRRVYSIHQYAPPLPALLAAMTMAPGGGIKLAPSVRYEELSATLAERLHEVEVISVSGEAREAVLWLGDLCRGERRATLLPAGDTLQGTPLRGHVGTAAPSRYLYEPDAAVIRAGLVENVALQIGAQKLDEELAYLTADTLVTTPFATAYQIDEVLPFNLKRLNRRLREIETGELVIKRRGFPVDPEEFRKKLRYGGGGPRRVLVLTRIHGQPTALLCQPVNH